MANVWKRNKPTRLLSPLFLLFSSTLIIIFFFTFLTSHPSNPSNPATTLTAFNTSLFFNAISPFNCVASP
ncbi:hypothetical protein HKD37_13G035305 [Glycine soja]